MPGREPNHICKHCGNAYYACDDCDKYHHWKEVGCCFEHAELYWRDVEASRAKYLQNIIPEQNENQPEDDEGDED